jgi:glucose/arabinose dehydrogenase
MLTLIRGVAMSHVLRFLFAVTLVLLARSLASGAPVTSLEKFEAADDVIWAMQFLPSREILFTERKGVLTLFDPRTGKRQVIASDFGVFAEGQGGLLDLRLHPDFVKNHRVYWTQTVSDKGQVRVRLSRAEFVDGKLRNRQALFETDPLSDNTINLGSRIAFSPDGFLFLSVGDADDRNKSQDLAAHNGKILRLTEDGKPAPGNPFAGQAGKKPEIWSYGHRNPQGLAFDPFTKELWTGEHGPRGGDELNLVQKGHNYGWPVITYGREYWGPKIGTTRKEGMDQPVHYYVPSIAPCGLLIYSGKAFPEWKGDFFHGALKLQHLNHVKIKDGKFQSEERLYGDLHERIRDVEENADGWIYFSTDSGKIYRIVPKKEASVTRR